VGDFTQFLPVTVFHCRTEFLPVFFRLGYKGKKRFRLVADFREYQTEIDAMVVFLPVFLIIESRLSNSEEEKGL
jgi:hypothetical protein